MGLASESAVKDSIPKGCTLNNLGERITWYNIDKSLNQGFSYIEHIAARILERIRRINEAPSEKRHPQELFQHLSANASIEAYL